jgi:hypothetical protein
MLAVTAEDQRHRAARMPDLLIDCPRVRSTQSMMKPVLGTKPSRCQAENGEGRVQSWA